MSVYSDECNTYVEDYDRDSDAPECHEYNNYYDEVSVKSIDDSFRQHKNGAKLSTKYEDKGYNRVQRRYKGKRVFVEYYESSSNPHVYIRDAISGAVRNPYRTGTTDEYLFFSVRIATGEGRTRGGSNLFYDSPEHYERHFHVEVPREIKNKWITRVTEARALYAAKVAEASKPKTIVIS